MALIDAIESFLERLEVWMLPRVWGSYQHQSEHALLQFSVDLFRSHVLQCRKLTLISFFNLSKAIVTDLCAHVCGQLNQALLGRVKQANLFIRAEGEDLFHPIQGVLIRNHHSCKLDIKCEVINRIDGRSQNDKGGYGFWGGALVRHKYCGYITIHPIFMSFVNL